MPTHRVQNLPAKIVENSGNMYRALRQAGYSHNYAKNPENIRNTKGYKQVMKPFLQQLKEEREKIIQEMRGRAIDGEKYKELAEVLDKFTKNIQLLEGKPTEITHTEDLSNLDDSELKRIAEGSEEDASQEGASEETS